MGKPKITVNGNHVVKAGLLTVFVLLFVFLLYVIIFSVLSSRRFASDLKADAYAIDSSDTYSFNELWELKRHNAFLQARLKLVEEDSVCLAINLTDSMVTLEQRGVVLHRAKILSCQSGKVFDRIGTEVTRKVFTSPLTVHQSFSSIPKIEYKLKIAPSDTSQAALVNLPDTVYHDPVCFCFIMDYGIHIEIRQFADPTASKCRKFSRQMNRYRSKKILTDLLAFRIPEYFPVIKIELPEADARSIYKSLPIHARIALSM